MGVSAVESLPPTNPLSGQATNSSLLRHHRLLACHSGAAFGFHKTRLRGMAKNRCKVHVIGALHNLFLARRILCGQIQEGFTCVYLGWFGPKDPQLSRKSRKNGQQIASKC